MKITDENHNEELTIFSIIADELENYIVEGEVYHTVLVPDGSGRRTIKMSGGDLLLRMKELQEKRNQMTEEEQQIFDKSVSQAKKSIHDLKTRFHEILERELKARRDALQWSMEDRSGNDNDDSVPPAEVDNREKIRMIQKELSS